MLSSLLGSNSAALVWTRIGNDFSDLGPLISPLPQCDLMSPQTCFPLSILLPSAQREKKSLSVWVSRRLLICRWIPVSFASCCPLTNGEAHCQAWLFLKSFYIRLKHPQEKKALSFLVPAQLHPWNHLICSALEGLTPLTLKPTLLATGETSEMV